MMILNFWKPNIPHALQDRTSNSCQIYLQPGNISYDKHAKIDSQIISFMALRIINIIAYVTLLDT
jgi:hypothetical protein